MVVVALAGGLGNQMFEYACGRCLADRLGLPLGLDTAALRLDSKRSYALERYSIRAQLFDSDTPWARARRRLGWPPGRDRLPIMKQARYVYDPELETVNGPVRLEGYWQSPRYFEPCADRIREDFALRGVVTTESATLLEEISAESSAVAVHVRRGDYVEDENVRATHGVLGSAYYAAARKALEAGVGPCKYFVFSDEPDSAAKAFGGDEFVRVVRRRRPVHPAEDMLAFSACRHHIIANSSFSWWGAWLRRDPTGQVFAPARWFADFEADTSALFPAGWRTI